MSKLDKPRVGEVRPSQLMFTYGVGALVDLPKLSVIVTGLEDWPTDPAYVKVVNEDRLLQAVRYQLPHVKKLLTPPTAADTGLLPDPFDVTTHIGVPVAAFPRWMVCPRCRLLAPLSSNLFDLKPDLVHMDRTAYKHTSCPNGHAPDVVPARFLAACEHGHLDDFPWVQFVHEGEPCDGPSLRLLEFGPSGEASDLQVRCDTCGKKRFLTDAFGQDNREKLPLCTARRPHLRDYDPAGCDNKIRPLTLGASNTWFPVLLSTVAIPVETDQLAQLVDGEWAKLQVVTSREVLTAFRSIGQLGVVSGYSDDDLWSAIQARRARDAGGIDTTTTRPDLKAPEWQVLTHFNPKLNTDDFQLRPVSPPAKFTAVLRQVVLVERLREVRALTGFTRIDAVGELTDPEMGMVEDEPAPLSRQATAWVPASEVRGEGIFLQFDEARLAQWLKQEAVVRREAEFFEAHKRWRAARSIKDPEDGFPGMRYVFLHTFAHVVMRELALECGYTLASIRERIYSRNIDEPNGPMAGVLIYTSAPDSEGTLGGLVNRGEPDVLGRHIAQALEAARLCASDPLCAEHPPSQRGQTLHAAACHACLFAPETSCERGNKYLDRSTLVKTVERSDLTFLG